MGDSCKIEHPVVTAPGDMVLDIEWFSGWCKRRSENEFRDGEYNCCQVITDQDDKIIKFTLHQDSSQEFKYLDNAN